MKQIILIIFLFFSLPVFSQVRVGFDGCEDDLSAYRLLVLPGLLPGAGNDNIQAGIALYSFPSCFL